MELTLIRKYHEEGTNGVLLYKGNFLCYTIELPWKQNRKMISCVPEGRYEIVSRYSQRFGIHFLVRGVPGRKYILIHPANNALKELKGCIAPVKREVGPGKGIGSRDAMKRIRFIVDPEIDKSVPVFLTIKSISNEKDISQGDEAYPEIL